jgi:hypothetical protein
MYKSVSLTLLLILPLLSFADNKANDDYLCSGNCCVGPLPQNYGVLINSQGELNSLKGDALIRSEFSKKCLEPAEAEVAKNLLALKNDLSPETYQKGEKLLAYSREFREKEISGNISLAEWQESQANLEKLRDELLEDIDKDRKNNRPFLVKVVVEIHDKLKSIYNSLT